MSAMLVAAQPQPYLLHTTAFMCGGAALRSPAVAPEAHAREMPRDTLCQQFPGARPCERPPRQQGEPQSQGSSKAQGDIHTLTPSDSSPLPARGSY
jgi:hypothetical protein